VKRATTVRPHGGFGPEDEVDRVELSYDGRHRRRMAMRGAGGLAFLLDLPEAVALREGDGLALEEGGVVRVIASAEPVAEIFGDVHLLSRVAWHLGNRHIPTEILHDRIRIGRDHVLEAMVAGLGARVVRVEAPFQPEPGAYAHTDGRTAHHHDHGDPGHAAAGHAHDHGDHGPLPSHDHDHTHDHAQPHEHADDRDHPRVPHASAASDPVRRLV
jgi:urease accessory protein